MSLHSALRNSEVGIMTLVSQVRMQAGGFKELAQILVTEQPQHGWDWRQVSASKAHIPPNAQCWLVLPPH